MLIIKKMLTQFEGKEHCSLFQKKLELKLIKKI